MKTKIYTITVVFLSIFLLEACVSSQRVRKKKTAKKGTNKPYVINNVKYYPENVKSYEKIGLASWYGSQFHGRRTANGEIFNKRKVTAAHRTLPLPSMVRVTNLSNKKSIVVRVNDRGPFVKKGPLRIIDLSERAAELLGFKNKGVAKVKVTLLPRATRKIRKKS